MKADATSIALSGIVAGQTRLQATAHNLANTLTEDFHRVRTVQEDVAEGGTRASQERSPEPESSSLAGELVEQTLASLQTQASLRALDTSLETLGNLLDIKR